jgi:enoyl-CoA hydratase/carnithine racemase
MGNPSQPFFLQDHGDSAILELTSPDNTNKLSLEVVFVLTDVLEQLHAQAESRRINRLIITGNDKFFSAGADLNEISRLGAPKALEFSRAGQRLTNMISDFPTPVFAAIRGYCMGGGMDLALACDYRIAAPSAVFGHRGASLGLITGWGGTQRLPRLIGKPRALQMFLLAERVTSGEALKIGLVDSIADDPISAAHRAGMLQKSCANTA